MQERVNRFAQIAALIAWIMLIAALASTYVGHAASPYGACYAPSGRSVPCAAIRDGQ